MAIQFSFLLKKKKIEWPFDSFFSSGKGQLGAHSTLLMKNKLSNQRIFIGTQK